jgi:hypothetical protein
MAKSKPIKMISWMTDFPSNDDFESIKCGLKMIGVKEGQMKYVKVTIEEITLKKMIVGTKDMIEGLSPEDRKKWESNAKTKPVKDMLFGKKKGE